MQRREGASASGGAARAQPAGRGAGHASGLPACLQEAAGAGRRRGAEGPARILSGLFQPLISATLMSHTTQCVSTVGGVPRLPQTPLCLTNSKSRPGHKASQAARAPCCVFVSSLDPGVSAAGRNLHLCQGSPRSQAVGMGRALKITPLELALVAPWVMTASARVGAGGRDARLPRRLQSEAAGRVPGE